MSVRPSARPSVRACVRSAPLPSLAHDALYTGAERPFCFLEKLFHSEETSVSVPPSVLHPSVPCLTFRRTAVYLLAPIIVIAVAVGLPVVVDLLRVPLLWCSLLRSLLARLLLVILFALGVVIGADAVATNNIVW